MKTNIDRISKPKIIFIVIGVLSGYIRNWPIFMLRLLLTFGKYKRAIKSDFPKEFISTTAFMAHLYLRLQKITDKRTAFELTRVVVLTMGLAVQQANFRNVEDKRKFSNLVLYQKRTNNDGITKMNKMKIVEDSENKYEFVVTSCAFLELFRTLGVEELTPILCSIDNAIFGSYLGDEIVFHRGGPCNTMAEGRHECRFVIEYNGS